MKPLKIYLGDLTYTTVSISNPVFPLNIGYIASYCKSRFGNKVEISLFKYINELYDAIEENPPDILGLSNYAWNEQISLEILKKLNTTDPNSIGILGGPNFPADLESQEKFLHKYPLIDVYIPIEGEIGFSNLVERALSSNSRNSLREDIMNHPIEGCITKDNDGKLCYSITSNRINNLDEIESPYTSGILDKFFDGKLNPMLQTNRGCPFSCSYCVDGSDDVRKVNRFNHQSVVKDLEYIGKHVPTNTHSLFISDLNFGMLPDDLKTCDAIVDIQNKYDFPKHIDCTTGKNSKEKIIEAVKRLKGTLRLLMSVQSMDHDVLTNIRRDNISLEQMMELAPTLKDSGLRTTSEVILGLPGESYESHVKTLRDLVHAKMDNILVYTCMMLKGAELDTPLQREKWQLKTKFRILPKDFVTLPNGKNILEVEEVVIGSNTLTFEEYVELRLLAFILYVTNMGVVFDPLLKFLREVKCDVFDLFYQMLKNSESAPKSIQNIFESYKTATKKELWDSPEEIHKFYQNMNEFEKLVQGKAGINVIQFHHALVTADHMDDWTAYAIDISKKLLKKIDLLKEEENQFNEIANYCKGLSHNVLGDNRMDTNPKFTFKFNIKNWLNNDSKLSSFIFSIPREIKFSIDDEQYKLVNDKLELFGKTTIGKSQALKHIPVHLLWRNPKIETVQEIL
jgi:radical SAM superfamily enzyme YgiQ (UPF0313 family)